MSIPKVIHYCWFGRGEKSDIIKKCMESWKIHCPDWEIIEWNEDNFDVNFCPYASKAYREKRWAYLSDAARLQIIYNEGGVYLDTDVELRHPIDELLNNEAWFGYATTTEIGTGVGFGAVKQNPFVLKLLEQYLSFPASKKYDLCTRIDAQVFKKEFPNFAANHSVRQEWNGILIIENIWHYAIHHYTNSWVTPWQKVLNRSKLWCLLRKVRNKVSEKLHNRH